jgi:hypothetical protein
VLVLLHATLHDHHDFDAIVALERRHQAIAADWPGCRTSPAAAVPASLSAAMLADDLNDLIALERASCRRFEEVSRCPF